MLIAKLIDIYTLIVLLSVIVSWINLPPDHPAVRFSSALTERLRTSSDTESMHRRPSGPVPSGGLLRGAPGSMVLHDGLSFINVRPAGDPDC